MVFFHSHNRKHIFLLSLLLSALFLSGCEKKTSVEKAPLVYITESKYYSVYENGLYPQNGKNVRFQVTPANGYSIVGTDYPGAYRIWEAGKITMVELLDINYPTRVNLKLSSKYRTITYIENNGTDSAPVVVTYDTSIHLRPNTSNGRSDFHKEGYTLESWNTMPDGSGERIGLGSRVSVPFEGLTLYAQWEKWTDASAFSYEVSENGLIITGCASNDSCIVIPQSINGIAVVSIASNAFVNMDKLKKLVLPQSLQSVESNAVCNCSLESLVLFDNIEQISDGSFFSCPQLTTLYINAIEAPYGYLYRRESMYADKIDLLIENQGQQKMIFFSGCSTWYNLDSSTIKAAFEKDYKIINLGLNGTVNAWVQWSILSNYVEEGDLFIHSPELSSKCQMLDYIDMSTQDTMLWCGLENNYDLFALVDISEIHGVFDSLSYYLGKKIKESSYDSQRLTNEGYPYIDDIGSIPFERTQTSEKLLDTVNLNVDKLTNRSYDNLQRWYNCLNNKGVKIYISYAVINIDAVSEDQQNNITAMHQAFSQVVDGLDGVVLISNLWDFVYHNSDFYDTNYHLLSKQVVKNTQVWIHDIKQQLAKD